MNRKSSQGEPHYSPIKFILEAKADNPTPQGKFVAFSQERDGLGRLLKDQNGQQPRQVPKMRRESEDSDLPKLVHTITPETCITLSDRVSLMEGQISRSFGFRDPREVKLFEGNRARIRKMSCPFDIKTNYGILSKGNDPQQYTQKEAEEKGSRAIKKDNERSSQGLVKSSRIASLPARTQNLPQRERRLATVDKSLEAPQIQRSKQQLAKLKACHKSVPKLRPLPPRANPVIYPVEAQIQSLQAYRRWPRLNDNIDQNNEMFITKVWQSKKLAYQMQQSLRQLEENF